MARNEQFKASKPFQALAYKNSDNQVCHRVWNFPFDGISQYLYAVFIQLEKNKVTECWEVRQHRIISGSGTIHDPLVLQRKALFVLIHDLSQVPSVIPFSSYPARRIRTATFADDPLFVEEWISDLRPRD